MRIGPPLLAILLFKIADRVYMVGQGRAIASGTPSELSTSSDAYVQQFLGGKPDGPIAFHYPESPAFKLWLEQRKGQS